MHAVRAAAGQPGRWPEIRDSVRRPAGRPGCPGRHCSMNILQPRPPRPENKRPGAGIRRFRHKVGCPQSLKRRTWLRSQRKSERGAAWRPPARFSPATALDATRGGAKQPRALSRAAEWTSSAGAGARTADGPAGPGPSAGVDVPRRFAFAADRRGALIPLLTHDWYQR